MSDDQLIAEALGLCWHEWKFYSAETFAPRIPDNTILFPIRTEDKMSKKGPSKNPRRHHNNDGRCQIRHGYTELQVKDMARRLGLPYWSPTTFKEREEFKQDIFRGENGTD